MWAWWQRHVALKQAREAVKNTRKLLRMHRDIIAPGDLAASIAATDSLATAVKTKDAGALEGLTGKLDEKLGKAFPRQSYAALRENVEVFLVAAIVAMGVRTFFLQPFKIPTGSMQPTLYGVYPYRGEDRVEPPLPYPDGSKPSLPEQLFGMAVQGKVYEPTGYRSRGDHIFVDRFTYHFRKPQRGDVIVFDTSEINHPQVRPGVFYIKRLIGLGGDSIQIKPPYVYVNDEKLDSRPAFERIYSCTNGYHGYVIRRDAEFINHTRNLYNVPPRNLFVLGDNSFNSADGRFWGSLPERALVGRAICVYWPFTERFGRIE